MTLGRDVGDQVLVELGRRSGPVDEHHQRVRAPAAGLHDKGPQTGDGPLVGPGADAARRERGNRLQLLVVVTRAADSRQHQEKCRPDHRRPPRHRP